MLDTHPQTLKHLGRFYKHLSLEEMFQSVFRASMLRERGCLERVQTVSSDPGFQCYTRYRVLLDTHPQTLKHLGRFYNHLSLEEMFQSVFRASMPVERGCLECVQTVSGDPGFGFYTR